MVSHSNHQVAAGIPLDVFAVGVQLHSDNAFSQHMDVSQIEPGDPEAAELTTLCYGTSQDTHTYASLYLNQC